MVAANILITPTHQTNLMALLTSSHPSLISSFCYHTYPSRGFCSQHLWRAHTRCLHGYQATLGAWGPSPWESLHHFFTIDGHLHVSRLRSMQPSLRSLARPRGPLQSQLEILCPALLPPRRPGFILVLVTAQKHLPCFATNRNSRRQLPPSISTKSLCVLQSFISDLGLI